MAKRLSSVIGIDIGCQSIKICEVRTQGKEPVVTALGMIDTPEGAVDHMGIYNPEAVAGAIKQALSQSGVSSGSAVVSIAGQGSVLVRTLEVPKMNPAELKEHMQWEINRNIPFAESNIVSDFKPLGDEDPNSQNMEVVMAIAPQSAIDNVITCVKKAGRQTAAIDVEPLSVARSIKTSYDDLTGGKTICHVDVGSKSSSINIYHGAKLLMPRQVPIGGEMFTKAIADALTLGIPDAEQVKTTQMVIPEAAAIAQPVSMNPFDLPGGPTQEFQPYNPFSDDAPLYSPANPFEYPAPAPMDADPSDYAPVDAGAPIEDTTPVVAEDSEAMRLYNTIAPVMEEFLSEIRRSIDYFRSRGGDVDLILLSGGGTKIKGFPEYLTKVLDIPCDAYDPLRRLNVNLRKTPPDFVDAHKQEFAVAIGNGLYIFFD